MSSWCFQKTLKLVAYFNKGAPWHGWNYSKYICFACRVLAFLKSWMHEHLKNHWNSIGNTTNAATRMELFNTPVFYCRALAFLKSRIHADFKKHCISNVISTNVLIHVDGVIQNTYEFLACFHTFELMLTSDFRKYWYFSRRTQKHERDSRWRQRVCVQFRLTCTLV